MGIRALRLQLDDFREIFNRLFMLRLQRVDMAAHIPGIGVRGVQSNGLAQVFEGMLVFL